MQRDQELNSFYEEIYQSSNKQIEIILLSLFGMGVLLSFFYDTWLVGLGVGSLTLIIYFLTKNTFKGKTVNQYVASGCLGIFMAQFIYQMHGMFEMHFIAFISAVALITYQNWRVFIPLTVFVVIHHFAFAYIQYLGVINDNEAYRNIYFTQLSYIDIKTFLIHAGLFALNIGIAASYAHRLAINTKASSLNIISLQKTEEVTRKNIEFANQMSEGKFEFEHQVDDNDELGKALVEMKQNLVTGAERERHERFINQGIADISNIVRDNKSGLSEMANELISYVVKYLDATQGGIFIVKDENDEKYLELEGCYAYERRKYLEKRVEFGEGLAGQCVLEKETIYMTHMPSNYVNITSGLGDANPNSVLIVPLKNDTIVEGVIEIASFKTYEQYQIDFLEKLGEIIAVSVTNARINDQTQKLYKDSQEQAEQLRSQEEEMRQNMEELTATQEEMRRKAFELESRITSIEENDVASIEFDMDGTIIEADPSFCKLMQYDEAEIKGQHHRIFVRPEEANSKEYEAHWKGLAEGKNQTGEFIRIKKDGSLVTLIASYSIIRDKDGKPVKVLKFAFDISHLSNNATNKINFQNVETKKAKNTKKV